MTRRKEEHQLSPKARRIIGGIGKGPECFYRDLLQAMKLRSICWLSILLFTLTCTIAGESPAPVRDGSHDFDFLIGNWKAHVRRLPDRLVGSNNWIEYNGISNHKKLLDSNANFEEFEVDNPEKHLHIRRRRLGDRIPTHSSGVIICSIWTKAF